MYTAISTLTSPELIPSTWILDSLRGVRDLLQTEGRDDLALTLSEAIGGLTVIDRDGATRTARKPVGIFEAEFLASGHPDDFEEIDPESSNPTWPEFSSRGPWMADEPTPLELLERGVPVSGGSAEAYQPSAEVWSDYAEWSARVDADDREAWMSFDDHACQIAEGYELGPDRFDEADARAAGLAV
jgi:hypothetical protein